METTSVNDNFCKEHYIQYLVCYSESCKNKNICKLCSYNKIEDLQHSLDHFDFIKPMPSKISEFKEKIRLDEVFTELNEITLNSLEKVPKVLVSLFNPITQIRETLRVNISEGLIFKYEELTKEFDELVQNFTKQINSIKSTDTNAKNEVHEMRTELDTKMAFLGDKEKIKLEYQKIISSVDKKVKSYKLQEIIDGKCKIYFGKNHSNLNWITGGPICNSSDCSGSNYKCIRSEEIVEGPFQCKVKIISINDNYVNEAWNYTFGIQKSDSTNNDSYYNDAVVLQSAGYINKFSGYSNKKEISKSWNINDELLMRRDENNNVYFGINCEQANVLGGNSVVGKFRIIMGFASSMRNDNFEMLELTKG
jgi:hypothetical protein